MIVVVQKGDCLWTIAARLCGDGRRWPELTPLHLVKPRRRGFIYAGDIFRIPASWPPIAPVNVLATIPADRR